MLSFTLLRFVVSIDFTWRSLLLLAAGAAAASTPPAVIPAGPPPPVAPIYVPPPAVAGAFPQSILPKRFGIKQISSTHVTSPVSQSHQPSDQEAPAQMDVVLSTTSKLVGMFKGRLTPTTLILTTPSVRDIWHYSRIDANTNLAQHSLWRQRLTKAHVSVCRLCEAEQGAHHPEGLDGCNCYRTRYQ